MPSFHFILTLLGMIVAAFSAPVASNRSELVQIVTVMVPLRRDVSGTLNSNDTEHQLSGPELYNSRVADCQVYCPDYMDDSICHDACITMVDAWRPYIEYPLYDEDGYEFFEHTRYFVARYGEIEPTEHYFLEDNREIMRWRQHHYDDQGNEDYYIDHYFSPSLDEIPTPVAKGITDVESCVNTCKTNNEWDDCLLWCNAVKPWN